MVKEKGAIVLKCVGTPCGKSHYDCASCNADVANVCSWCDIDVGSSNSMCLGGNSASQACSALSGLYKPQC